MEKKATTRNEPHRISTKSVMDSNVSLWIKWCFDDAYAYSIRFDNGKNTTDTYMMLPRALTVTRIEYYPSPIFFFAAAAFAVVAIIQRLSVFL